MIRRSVLPNGVVVLTERLKHCRSVAVDFWLGVGSRQETAKNNGIAHFFEHALFKGTQNFTPLELVSAIERKGGMINASTTRERTHFYVRTAAKELPTAITILGEMLNAPLLRAAEMKMEREVILEEIRGVLDLPDELADDLFCEALWGKEGLGRPIAGTLGSVRCLGRTQLLEHRQGVMGQWPLIVSAAGALEHDEVVERVRVALPEKRRTVAFKPQWQTTRVAHLVRHRDIQQASIVLGTGVPLVEEREGIALALLHLLLGEGMSSRLFQRIREERGLVYFISTNAMQVSGGGVFSVMFGAEPEKAKITLKELSNELSILRRIGFSADEVEMAKEMMRGGMQLNAETTADRSSLLARWEFLGRRPETLEEKLKKVEAVTLSDVNEMLQKVLRSEGWAGAAVVPLKQHLDLRCGLNF